MFFGAVRSGADVLDATVTRTRPRDGRIDLIRVPLRERQADAAMQFVASGPSLKKDDACVFAAEATPRNDDRELDLLKRLRRDVELARPDRKPRRKRGALAARHTVRIRSRVVDRELAARNDDMQRNVRSVRDRHRDARGHAGRDFHVDAPRHHPQTEPARRRSRSERGDQGRDCGKARAKASHLS